MKKAILLFSVLALVGSQSGCTTLPGSDLMTSKGNEEKMVTTSAQFDEMAGNSSRYLGQKKMLAGAVASIDQTDEGYLVLAQWLPYPKTQLEQGPVASQAAGKRHFLIRFIGKREKEFYTTRGNIFLLEGTIEGTKKALVKVFGPKNNLLFVNAKCINIWETGQDNDRSSQMDNQYPPVRQRTLCAD